MSRLMEIARNFQFDPSVPITGSPAEDRGCDKSDKSDKRGPVGHSSDEINEKSEKRIINPYQERARAALARIRRPDYPVDLIPWLGEKHPALYGELTANLPDEIHRLWTDRAPLPEFQRILDLWLTAHETACEMYRSAHKPREEDK
jgi:hypothetical protein